MNRELKSMLIKKGIKQKAISERAGVTRATVSCVLGGHSQSMPVKRATAELLQISMYRLETLWRRKTA